MERARAGDPVHDALKRRQKCYGCVPQLDLELGVAVVEDVHGVVGNEEGCQEHAHLDGLRRDQGARPVQRVQVDAL